MALNWRDAVTVELNAQLIPDPNAGHILLDRLRNVQVAVDGGFLHIDARPVGERDRRVEHKVYLVSAAAVRSVEYKVPARLEPEIEVRTG
ncbi:hypothetical protein ACTOXX_34245 [Streptomyces rubiginosohelvolus]|uniref:hypothetical protein n=1 Tax=Streptomyces rubiginosohelvolus TaxID=67362 RepID=UPI003F90934E